MAFKSKNYRRFIATAATAALVTTAVVPAVGATSQFSDVGERYKEAVDYLYENKIINGISETKFGTTQEIKRVDVAVMIANALLTEEEIEQAKASGFTDVPERAEKHVNALKERGYVNGKSETQFNASAPITRGEVAIMLANAYGLSGDEENVSFTDVAERYKKAVAALVDNEITQGKEENRFGTTDAITRGELAIFLYRTEILENEDGEDEDEEETEEEFKVETVEALETTIDVDAEEQFLSFTVNGEEITLDKLKDEGYQVEFNSTTSGIFKDKATGELNKEKIREQSSFKYQVILTKDEEKITSNLATVKVEKYDSLIVSLDKYDLVKSGAVLKEQTIVHGEKTTIMNVKGKSKLGGEKAFSNEELTFESSDQTKLLVNAKGEITTVSAGDAKVIVRVKDTDVALEIPITVSTKERKADQMATAKKDVSVVVNGELKFPFEVKDQYGEPFESYTMENVDVKDGDQVIASVKVKTIDAKKGLYEATVNASAKAGTGTFEVKLDGKTALSLPVTVDDDTAVDSRKLELVSSAENRTIDLNPMADKQSVDFVFNKYNAAGIFISQEKNIGTDSAIYTVTANNDNVQVSVRGGVITVKGEKVGSSVISVKEGDIERGKMTVTVENTSPQIDSVTFTGNKLEKTPALLSDILTVDGIELTKSANIQMDYANGKAILFVDVEGTEADPSYGKDDILLGMVEFVSADIPNVSISADGEFLSEGKPLKIGTSGATALTITNNDESVAVQTVDVNIKEAREESLK